MADISKYIEEFENASDGSFARLPIINALKEINDVGGDAESFSGYTADQLLKRSESFERMYMDDKPNSSNTNRAVKSGGLYEEIGNVLKIEGFDPLE